MIIIEHRKNTIEALKKVSVSHGVEIDIRSHDGRLVLNHDPFCGGEDFEEWLKYYSHKFIILNIKEEGLEERIKELIGKNGIKDYFFLDLSFPFLVRQMNAGERNISVRFSEYESAETCLSLAGKVDWVWVDCYTTFPLDKASYDRLSKHFKICLVSPDLVGRKAEIVKIRSQISGMKIDAVCTKLPSEWAVARKNFL